MEITVNECAFGLKLFQDMTPDEAARIKQLTTMTTSRAGRVFYRPGEHGKALFLLERGRVLLYRISPEGKKLVVALLEAGGVFGEMSLVSRGIHSTFAEALTDCRLCILRSEHVIHLMKKEPQVTLRILESMALRLKQAESKLEDLAFKGIPARLTSLLLALARGEGGTRVVDGYSHQDLAEMLGTYRETTTQVLNNFKEQGWIEIGRRQITILDLQAMLNATSSGRPPEPQGRREPGSHRMA